MKKVLFAFLVLVSFNSYAVFTCKTENNVYGIYGNWLGCKIPKTDNVLNSTWFSPVINTYGNDRYEGLTYFKIDRRGKYTARTLIRRAGKHCLEYGAPWGTQLYKVDYNTYASWDEYGLAYYLIVKSKNGQTASSHLAGGPGTTNVSERNVFFRMPKFITMNNILRLSDIAMCKDTEK